MGNDVSFLDADNGGDGERDSADVEGGNGNTLWKRGGGGVRSSGEDEE